jgi:hypothetical protein
MLISFDEALAVGVQMHDRFVANGITPPMVRDDYGWGDLVQFVIRQSNVAVAGRGGALVDAAIAAEEVTL